MVLCVFGGFRMRFVSHADDGAELRQVDVRLEDAASAGSDAAWRCAFASFVGAGFSDAGDSL